MRSEVLFIVALLLLFACAPKAAPLTAADAAAGSAAPRVPAGCEHNLSGAYVHALHPGFRYRGEDDGNLFTLALERSPEAGTATPGPPAVTLRLRRTPEGFRGTTVARVPVGTRECAVEFPTELVGCSDAGLQLRAARQTSLDESCRPPTHPGPAEMVDQRLLPLPRAEEPRRPPGA